MSNQGSSLQQLKANVVELLKKQRFEEALHACQRVCDAAPRNAESWHMLALIHSQLGRLEPAAGCFRRATELQPAYAEAHYNLARILQLLARHSEAESSYRKALAIEPGHYLARYGLALSLQHLGDLAEAESSYREALELKPDEPQILLALGNLLFEMGKMPECESCYKEALHLQPGYTAALANLGKLQQSQGRFSEAEENFRRALKIQPSSFDTYNELGTALSAQGRLEEAEEAYRKALALKPDFHVACSNLLLTLNYSSRRTPEQIFDEHERQGQAVFGHIRRFDDWPNTADPARPLRIGYLSPDFRDHSVACFLEALIRHHDPAAFKTICYSDVRNGDPVTERLKQLSDEWRPVSGLPHETVARMIRDDRIDLLVDLSGHTAHNRLPVFASRPAPVQLNYLGYPNTTGLSEIAYRLTDEVADPHGVSDSHFTETLVRLPGCFLCYTPPAAAPSPGRCPSEGRGYVTFGSFNNFAKMTPDVLETWASLMNAVPGSRLVLKNLSLSDRGVRTRCHALFERCGIRRDRVELLGTVPSKDEHLRLYERIDVGLDTFPYNGTTTTCEALWMGVPVVVLEGDCHAGRVGASLLSSLGLERLIAADKDGYCALAAALAADPDQRRKWRTSLRDLMAASPLCDGPAFTRHVESAYRRMWAEWCRNREAQDQP